MGCGDLPLGGGAGEGGEVAVFRGLEGFVEAFDLCGGVERGAEGDQDGDLREVAGAGGGVEFRGEGVAFSRC